MKFRSFQRDCFAERLRFVSRKTEQQFEVTMQLFRNCYNGGLCGFLAAALRRAGPPAAFVNQSEPQPSRRITLAEPPRRAPGRAYFACGAPRTGGQIVTMRSGVEARRHQTDTRPPVSPRLRGAHAAPRLLPLPWGRAVVELPALTVLIGGNGALQPTSPTTPPAPARALAIQTAMAAELKDVRLKPFIMLHEFEALVFACLNQCSFLSQQALNSLTHQAAQYPSPEHNNDRSATAPSAQLRVFTL